MLKTLINWHSDAELASFKRTLPDCRLDVNETFTETGRIVSMLRREPYVLNYSQPFSEEFSADIICPREGSDSTFSGENFPPQAIQSTLGAIKTVENSTRLDNHQLFVTDTPCHEPSHADSTESFEDMPAGRYFDELEGPGLEILKDCEETLIPPNQSWPFLLRFPISSFSIPMALGSQTVLWKNLASSSSTHFLHIPRLVNLMFWYSANISLVIIFATYGMKCLLYFEAVRREYHHPVRINYFFAPWISCMFLTLGMPPTIGVSFRSTLWCLLTLPIGLLELKLYGQWLSGDNRRLCKVANPSTHMAVVGNFVGAEVCAMVGWKELATALWAIGIVHYLVVFVTLYQRLPTSEALPKDLHPVFFLFIAAPSTASVAWEMIVGEFDSVSRIVFFIALFLFCSLVVRLNLFRGMRFSVAWWAYVFPMSALSIAAIHYCENVTTLFTQALATTLSLLSTTMFLTLLILSTCHTCIWGDFFPNDVAIAITKTRRTMKPKTQISDDS